MPKNTVKAKWFLLINGLFILGFVFAAIRGGNAKAIEDLHSDEPSYSITLSNQNRPTNLSPETFVSGSTQIHYVVFDYFLAKRSIDSHVILNGNGHIKNNNATKITSLTSFCATFSGESATVRVGPDYDLLGEPAEVTSETTIVLPNYPYYFKFQNTGTEPLILTSLTLCYTCSPYYSKIIFNTNGGSEISPLVAPIGSGTIAPANPTKIGHTFDGWYSDETLWQSYVFDTMPNSEITLYAKWSADQFMVTLNANGGTLGPPTTTTLTYGEHFVLPVPGPTSLPFGGWYYNEKKYTDKLGNSLIPWEEASDTTLMAQYYYSIATRTDLSSISSNLSGTYRLIADIDLENFEWVPIGYSSPFAGSFDGDGHTISNLKIWNALYYYNGLFGRNNGTIKNINLENVNINLGGVTPLCVGSFVGSNAGLITNLEARSGTITHDLSSGMTGYTGGIVAYHSINTTLDDLTNRVSVTGISSSGVGGIAGYAALSSGNLSMSNLYNFANISNTTDYVGGIIGRSSASLIDDVTNEGNVTGCNHVGGIISHGSDMTISNAQNAGSIQGVDYIGGIVGTSSNTLTINGGTSNSGNISGDNYVGGIAGNVNYSEISQTANFGASTGKERIGGIIGNSMNYVTINISFNGGTINASGTYYAGGFVGYSQGNIRIEDCHNDGSVSGTTTYGGAIIGFSWSAIYLERVMNTADISVSNGGGGLVGGTYYQTTVIDSINFGDTSISQSTSYCGAILSYSNTTPTGSDIYYTGSVFANGIIVSGTSFGTKVTNFETITPSFFTTTLGWSDDIWNFAELDVGAGVYPSLIAITI